MFEELRQDFVNDTMPLVGSIEAILLEMERIGGRVEGWAEERSELMSLLHTVKGNAGMMGLAQIQSLAHTMEGIVKELPRRSQIWGRKATDLLLSGVSELVQALDSVARNAESELDTAGIRTQLDGLLRVHDRGQAGGSEKQGSRPQSLGGTAGLPASPSGLPEKKTHPGAPAGAGMSGGGNSERTAGGEEDAPLETAWRDPGKSPPLAVGSRTHRSETGQGNSREEVPGTPCDAEAGSQGDSDILAGGSAGPLRKAPVAGSTLVSRSDTIKVDFRKLDHLLNLVGELVIHQTTLNRRLSRVATSVSPDEWRPLERTSEAVRKAMLDLQQSVMDTRLLPVSTVFGRFERLVRDLAKQQKKKIDFLMQGEETEIDKTILDALAEPLLHLIRNSVDHGIEQPDKRMAGGKPAHGTILLSAAQIGKQIRIDVSDDGAGLDSGKLLARGLELGFDVAGLDPKQLTELIFASGFTTAEKVTELSGRGVGLDAVRRNIERLGGHLIVSSVPGKGTRFTLLMPLTLAIIEALTVEIAGELYALPLSGIIESIPIEAAVIHRVGELPVCRWRHQIVPVVDLGERFRLEREALSSAQFVVVIFGGGRLAVLPVDRLLGREELVIKGLDNFLGEPAGIAGAAILGTGRVLLVLDLAAIVSMRERKFAKRLVAEKET